MQLIREFSIFLKSRIVFGTVTGAEWITKSTRTSRRSCRKAQGYERTVVSPLPYIISDIFDLVRYSLERMESWKTFLITEARFVYANENEVFEGSTTPFAEAVRAQETRVTMGVSES